MDNDQCGPGSASGGVERRLATILMADMVGYSRLMGYDEERTAPARWMRCAVRPISRRRCARAMSTLPEKQRMWFRIGINLGDVIVQRGDLLGDGVNVAARLQTIAEPGGICISGSVYDQIENKLTLHITQLGEKTFKNIAKPIRTYSISDEGGAPLPVSLGGRTARKWPNATMAAIIIGLIAVGGTGYWLYRDYGLRIAEDVRRTKESQRAAELQIKAEEEKAAAALAQKAKLLAELQSAKDALTQAEASEREAEQETTSKATAEREATLLAEKQSAKQPQQAEAGKRKAKQDRLVAEAAQQETTPPGELKSANAYADRGRAWDKKGDWDRAIADLDAAIKLDPKLANTLEPQRRQ